MSLFDVIKKTPAVPDLFGDATELDAIIAEAVPAAPRPNVLETITSQVQPRLVPLDLHADDQRELEKGCPHKPEEFSAVRSYVESRVRAAFGSPKGSRWTIQTTHPDVTVMEKETAVVGIVDGRIGTYYDGPDAEEYWCPEEHIFAAIRTYEAKAARERDEKEDHDLAAEMDPCLIASAGPVRMAVPLLAPVEALTLLRGVSGSGKGWLLAYAAVCKALGAPFFGHPVERGRVLLIFLESPTINAARIELIVRGLGRTMDELRGWLDLWPIGLELKTDKAESCAELARRHRRRSYEFIGVDNTTRMRTSRAGNAENDSSILSGVLEPLADLAQIGRMNGELISEKRPAIVVLDHDRGSSASPQNADYVVRLERTSKTPDPESAFTLSLADGCRVCCEALPIRAQFLGVAPSPVQARLVGDAPAAPSDRLAAIVNAIRENPGIGVNAICRATGRTGKASVSDDLDKLVSADRIRIDEHKKYHPLDEE